MTTSDKKNLLVMKLLHYFITEKNYNPVIVHGIDNEIWLENMDSEFRIVRIVMGYIHNKEQLDFDNYKVEKLTKQIKRKTFTFKMKTLSLYLDLNSGISLENTKFNYAVNAKNETILKKNKLFDIYFTDIGSKLKFTEEGELLYHRINNDILKKNVTESKKINELFTPKKSYTTYFLIGIIVIFYIILVFNGGSTNKNTLYKYGALVKDNNPLRLLFSMFLHIGIIHFLANVWSLYAVGKIVEDFYGHVKTFIIFIFSGLIGNLLSYIVMDNLTISAGASGAIYGLMGALLYFSLNQRTYMVEALKNQILPILILNLLISASLPSVNLCAHIGGLVAGIIMSITLGVKYKTSKSEKINGLIASTILTGALIYFSYFK